jgi:hypothetical protein
MRKAGAFGRRLGGGAATPGGTWLGSGYPGEWFWNADGFTRAPL